MRKGINRTGDSFKLADLSMITCLKSIAGKDYKRCSSNQWKVTYVCVL